MERSIEVRHVSLEIQADFDHFTSILEESLGRFDEALVAGVETDPGLVEERLNKSAGEEGLMLFSVRDHGKLQSIHGTPKKARQYVVGNPLIATLMTRHDIRAGLYAPLRLLVYEAEDRSTRVEFDQPSSLFGQFGNPAVTAVARSLDAKLASLIVKVATRAGKSARP